MSRSHRAPILFLTHRQLYLQIISHAYLSALITDEVVNGDEADRIRSIDDSTVKLVTIECLQATKQVYIPFHRREQDAPSTHRRQVQRRRRSMHVYGDVVCGSHVWGPMVQGLVRGLSRGQLSGVKLSSSRARSGTTHEHA